MTAEQSDVLQVHSFFEKVGAERSAAGVAADDLPLLEDVLLADTVNGANLAEELVQPCLLADFFDELIELLLVSNSPRNLELIFFGDAQGNGIQGDHYPLPGFSS